MLSQVKLKNCIKKFFLAIEQRVIYPKTSNTSSASSMIGGNSSYNTANIMNCSYNSTLGVGYCDSNGAYSPWQSQQQLEGEIVYVILCKKIKLILRV